MRHHGKRTFGNFGFQCWWNAKGSSLFGSRLNSSDPFGVCMPSNHGTPRCNKVYIAILVLIEEVRTLRVREENRRSTNSVKGAYWRVYPTWNYFLCLIEQGAATLVLHHFTLSCWPIASSFERNPLRSLRACTEVSNSLAMAYKVSPCFTT